MNDRRTGSADDHHLQKTSNPVALWDPGTQISPDIWRKIGLDPATASSTLGGIAPPRGFALYGGHCTTRMYSITVWSQIYTVEDFRRKEGIPFSPITIAGRPAYHYAPAGDTTGDHHTIIFPTPRGSCSIQIIRQSPRAPATPYTKALNIATVLGPLFPK